MNLDTFTPSTRDDGDRIPAKELVNRALIVQVREHRTGIKTQFNSNPADPGKYKPEGGDAVQLDVVDLTTGAIYIGVLWFNGAIVDNLKGYVASTLPVKLSYETPKSGGNQYITVVALEGQELAYAQQWAITNPNRLEWERTARSTHGTATPAATSSLPNLDALSVPTAQAGGMPPIPGAPQQPPPWAAPTGSPAPAPPPATAPGPTAPALDPAALAAAAQDPHIQALLAQLAGNNPST